MRNWMSNPVRDLLSDRLDAPSYGTGGVGPLLPVPPSNVDESGVTRQGWVTGGATHR